MKKIKLGFIGFGKSTHRYHMPFIDQEKFQILSYYTRGTRVFEMPYPLSFIQQYKTLEEFLQSDIDLVVVTSPASVHYEHAKAALSAGKHVLVEKPFCHTIEELKELYQLAHDRHLKLLPYQNRRFDSDFLTFKKVIDSGILGEILEIESNYTSYQQKITNPSAGSLYDGSVYGLAVHFVDQIVSYFGKPDHVIHDITNQAINSSQQTSTQHIPEDFYDIKLIYDKIRIRIRHSQSVVHPSPRWIVHGTEGSFEKYMIDQQERDLKKGIFPNDPNFGKDLPEGIGTVYFPDGSHQAIDTVYKGYNQFYDDLYNYLNDKGSAPVSYHEIKTVLTILYHIVQKNIGVISY
ncbi:MAG: Gfo/Idh/MocA family oxidoreductase [Brevinema sp.]